MEGKVDARRVCAAAAGASGRQSTFASLTNVYFSASLLSLLLLVSFAPLPAPGSPSTPQRDQSRRARGLPALATRTLTAKPSPLMQDFGLKSKLASMSVSWLSSILPSPHPVVGRSRGICCIHCHCHCHSHSHCIVVVVVGVVVIVIQLRQSRLRSGLCAQKVH